MYRIATALFTVTAALVFASGASAQGFNAWGIGGQPNPWLQGNQGNQGGQTESTPYYGPRVGTLPNGTAIHNPWLRYRGVQPVLTANVFNNAVNYNTLAILNPSLYPLQSFNPYNRFVYSNYGYNQWNNSGDWGYTPRYEREVGTFISVNPQLAVNPFSGTVLNPIRGVAATREGYFYRMPGTGSISPWGNFIPGSGVYVNPFTGARYNPLTGVIAR